MPSLAVLVLATPIWGFALRAPSAPDALTVGGLGYEVAADVTSAAEGEVPFVPQDTLHREKQQWSRGIVVGTAASMVVTEVIGAILFADAYGLHDRYADTPCAQGTGILNRCGDEVPWQYAVATGFTAAGLVFASLKSLFIDFEEMAREDPDWRVYETTRWVALGMGLAHAIAGILITNAVAFGWADQVQDFETLQGLAIGNMALGTATLGVQVANSILLF